MSLFFSFNTNHWFLLETDLNFGLVQQAWNLVHMMHGLQLWYTENAFALFLKLQTAFIVIHWPVFHFWVSRSFGSQEISVKSEEFTEITKEMSVSFSVMAPDPRAPHDDLLHPRSDKAAYRFKTLSVWIIQGLEIVSQIRRGWNIFG